MSAWLITWGNTVYDQIAAKRDWSSLPIQEQGIQSRFQDCLKANPASQMFVQARPPTIVLILK